MSDLLKDSQGHNSSKRWFSLVCLFTALGLIIRIQFYAPLLFDSPGFVQYVGLLFDMAKGLLWAAMATLVGGTAAEKIEALKR